jgi:glucose uptake protein GlcU
MLKNRVLAIQLGVAAAYGVIAFFSDWIPPAISAILGVIWFVAIVIAFGGLEFASRIDEDNRRDRSLSELIREARDQDSSPR